MFYVRITCIMYIQEPHMRIQPEKHVFVLKKKKKNYYGKKKNYDFFFFRVCPALLACSAHSAFINPPNPPNPHNLIPSLITLITLITLSA